MSSLRNAVTQAEASGARPWVVDGRERLAEALLEHGEIEGSRAMADLARREADALGTTAVVARAEELLS